MAPCFATRNIPHGCNNCNNIHTPRHVHATHTATDFAIHSTTHCNTLQHTLLHTTTHCNTPELRQHTQAKPCWCDRCSILNLLLEISVICACICMYAHMHICTRKPIHTHTHTHELIDQHYLQVAAGIWLMNEFTCMYAYLCIYVYTHTHIYVYTHTHKLIRTPTHTSHARAIAAAPSTCHRKFG